MSDTVTTKPNGPNAGDEVSEVAESMAEALGAVQQILDVLIREARLTEAERKTCLDSLAIVERNVEWADPHDKRTKVVPVP